MSSSAARASPPPTGIVLENGAFPLHMMEHPEFQHSLSTAVAANNLSIPADLDLETYWQYWLNTWSKFEKTQTFVEKKLREGTWETRVVYRDGKWV
ncbi:hypothetical protein N0V90_009976 [Kalmusia sp. IMI 367209]|nr:hypothetical protein N0V90_009976 [Kalmusia sp. IMI 367209]